MNQKEKIINLLNENGPMTQSALAEHMYGDKNHISNIYSALVGLMDAGTVYRTNNKPFTYSLTRNSVISPKKANRNSNKHRDVSNDKITNSSLEEAETLVLSTNNYGPENALITRCLQRFPMNTDPDIVAMKIGLIDITNSTHLSQHKSRINMVEFANIIATIPDIDARIQSGDPELVNEIARSNGNINLFSFASKYCCYHNRSVYNQDDYSILDTVLKEYLPRYFSDITQNQIQKWQNHYQYKEYNDYISRKLDELEITVMNRKRKFDHFVWYKNR